MTKAQKAERAEAIARMHEWVKPGDTVYTILRHVSRSGMQREIGVVLLLPEDRREEADARHGGRTLVDLHPNYPVSVILGARTGKHDGVVVGGCGMDMGFHLVYTLSHYLYPDGFGCIGEGCPSNDHSNGDRSYSAHEGGSREVTFRDRANPDASSFVAVGDWGERIGTGARIFNHTGGTVFYLFDDEVLADEPSGAAHWHRDGGYALRQRWL